MEIKDSVQQIREFISAADTESALDKTRALLNEHQLEEQLAHLDMIHSEWNDIKEQELNGLLDVEAKIRLQNANRARLLQLLLDISGATHFDANLVPKNSPAPAQPNRNQAANDSFKTWLKNLVGIGLLLPAVGAIIEAKWATAALFALAGAITLVPALRLIEKTLRYELLSWQKYLILIGSLLSIGWLNQAKQAEKKLAAPEVERRQ